MKQNRFMRNAAILLFAMALLGCMAALEKPVVTSAALTGADASGSDEVRGVWISFRDYKNAGLCDKSERAFGASADAYFQKLKDDGINTVFFHVVPCNDAIYPSRYLPFSPYMFESKPDYDPLEILVDTAHSYDLSFHAWINPYRRTMDVIYDPAKASSTNRIVRIVKEILKNYDVDGIHFDDYFYPARTKGAQLSGVSVAKRKAVINKMVKKVYRTVKDYDEDLLFGISPAGNIAYADSIGCDLKAWMSRDGYIDYIVPQIYWSDRYRMNGKMTKLYSSRLDEWLALNKNLASTAAGAKAPATSAGARETITSSRRSSSCGERAARASFCFPPPPSTTAPRKRRRKITGTSYAPSSPSRFRRLPRRLMP